MHNFKKTVIEIVKRIPKGKVASYGQIAALAGSPRAARDVGDILRTSDKEVPWWRVVNIHGYLSIRGNDVTKDTQKEFLLSENIYVDNKYVLNMKKYRWLPDIDLLEKEIV